MGKQSITQLTINMKGGSTLVVFIAIALLGAAVANDISDESVPEEFEERSAGEAAHESRDLADRRQIARLEAQRNSAGRSRRTKQPVREQSHAQHQEMMEDRLLDHLSSVHGATESLRRRKVYKKLTKGLSHGEFLESHRAKLSSHHAKKLKKMIKSIKRKLHAHPRRAARHPHSKKKLQKVIKKIKRKLAKRGHHSTRHHSSRSHRSHHRASRNGRYSAWSRYGRMGTRYGHYSRFNRLGGFYGHHPWGGHNGPYFGYASLKNYGKHHGRYNPRHAMMKRRLQMMKHFGYGPHSFPKPYGSGHSPPMMGGGMMGGGYGGMMGGGYGGMMGAGYGAAAQAQAQAQYMPAAQAAQYAMPAQPAQPAQELVGLGQPQRKQHLVMKQQPQMELSDPIQPTQAPH